MPINTRPSGITVESDVGIAARPELKLRRRRLGTWPETRPAAAAGAPGRVRVHVVRGPRFAVAGGKSAV